MSLKPSLVVISTDAGPPAAIAQLKGAGVPVFTLPGTASIDGVKERITRLGQAFGREAEGAKLIQQLDTELAANQPRPGAPKPKVMFIYARGAGAVNVAGTDNAAAEMIRLAGGTNAVTDYAGYRPLTAEAVTKVAPDVILLPSLGLESMGGVEGILKQPGVSLTPAGQNKRVVAMDDLLLLGFTPRTGQAVGELASKIGTR